VGAKTRGENAGCQGEREGLIGGGKRDYRLKARLFMTQRGTGKGRGLRERKLQADRRGHHLCKKIVRDLGKGHPGSITQKGQLGKEETHCQNKEIPYGGSMMISWSVSQEST